MKDLKQYIQLVETSMSEVSSVLDDIPDMKFFSFIINDPENSILLKFNLNGEKGIMTLKIKEQGLKDDTKKLFKNKILSAAKSSSGMMVSFENAEKVINNKLSPNTIKILTNMKYWKLDGLILGGKRLMESRVDELKGIKNYKEKIMEPEFNIPGNPIFVAQNIKDVLLDKGFEEIGTGNFSNVFVNDKFPYVLKVFDTTNLASGYYKFIKYTEENPSEHFPRYRGKLTKITTENHKGIFISYYAIRIEKLNPISPINFKLIKRIIGNVRSRIIPVFDPSKYNDYNQDIDTIKELYNILKKLNEIQLLDASEGNFMQRDDGTIVIIDPWFG